MEVGTRSEDRGRAEFNHLSHTKTRTERTEDLRGDVDEERVELALVPMAEHATQLLSRQAGHALQKG